MVLGDDIVQKILIKLEYFPYETTSSMHSDFERGGKTELQSLMEYVVLQAKTLHLEIPTYEKILTRLKRKEQQSINS